MTKLGFLELHEIGRVPVNKLPVEVVERKGLGHPDSMCDGIVERFGFYLLKYYYEHFGIPLHYNVDKCVLVGGQSKPRFGGGEILTPIFVHIVGRATNEVKTEEGVEWIPVEILAKKAMADFIKENFRFLNPYEHMRLETSVRPGSVDLVHLFKKQKSSPLANDTSIGVGFYPFSPTEEICLKVEKFLNSKALKEKLPAVGEDIKVMCVRRNRKLRITIAAAIVSKFVRDINEYVSIKEEIKEEVEKNVLDKYRNEFDEISVYVNTADDIERGIVYITVTGTSAEAGDDGQAGRGNRANGLITPYRWMSIEAAAGKNAYNHVGKIYQIFAQQLAQKIVEEVTGVMEASVILVSTIGKPIDQPQLLDVGIIPEERISIESIRVDVEGVIESELERLPKFWKEYLEKGGFPVF